jgi:anaerobic selenocysteine-containing dehydrogenase
MNAADLTALGLEHGDLVDVESVVDSTRTLRMVGLTAVAHEISRGSVATYYPEANVLVPLSWHDERSGTPSYKCVPVLISKAHDFSRNA